MSTIYFKWNLTRVCDLEMLQLFGMGAICHLKILALQISDFKNEFQVIIT
jgi:hypothetical protein